MTSEDIMPYVDQWVRLPLWSTWVGSPYVYMGSERSEWWMVTTRYTPEFRAETRSGASLWNGLYFATQQQIWPFSNGGTKRAPNSSIGEELVTKSAREEGESVRRYKLINSPPALGNKRGTACDQRITRSQNLMYNTVKNKGYPQKKSPTRSLKDSVPDLVNINEGLFLTLIKGSAEGGTHLAGVSAFSGGYPLVKNPTPAHKSQNHMSLHVNACNPQVAY
ncbi:hypothetical protein B0H16DRAFT_1464137 [Mycena metata]|uniref:Uncharacterized protein n=1 Tax=Mycena metata TaxID=1033252 RepID=A0AAD7IHX0_9AGAR|nr:hypothetical protein B0H16DRAFT_1464137 [Mycena metata]